MDIFVFGRKGTEVMGKGGKKGDRDCMGVIGDRRRWEGEGKGDRSDQFAPFRSVCPIPITH